MKFQPLLGTDLSGSVGGIVASHNRGGAYFRNRSIPTNPNSVQQQAVRGIMASLTSHWNNTLTAAQRTAWDTYALNVELPNSLGDPRNVGGLGMYIRSNVGRIQATFGRIDAAPPIFNLGEFTNPTWDNFDAAADTFDTNFTTGDDWVSEDGALALLYSSRPQNPTINFFKGPYRLVGAIVGNSGTPPTSPNSGNAAFAFEVGQRVFMKFSISRADGRLSLPFRGFGLGA
ncbi:MAG: hypothetical protein KAI97_05525 [Gemmatimonadetes bacterium]|nr:hypothetical protein [Gemmatimonadota bacterium]